MSGLALDGQGVADGRLVLGRPARRALVIGGKVREVALDGVPIPTSNGDTRVPAIPGELTWVDEAGQPRSVSIEVDPRERPGVAQRDCMAGFVRRVGWGQGAPVRLTLSQLRAHPLFFHDGLWKQLRPEPFDGQVAGALSALFDIARRPRSRLREENVVLPVERVRRPARDADRWLVREGRGLVGGFAVRPTQLLARLLEDDLAIYENAVVVALCRWARERALRRADAVALALDEAKRIYEDLTRLTRLGLHERVGRWRKAAGVDDSIEALIQAGEAYRAALRRQIEAFAAILDGPVGVALRDDAGVFGALRPTNILAHDERYAAVARLWRARPIGPAAGASWDDPDLNYRRFLRMATGQALGALRFVATQRDAAFPLDDGAPPIELQRVDGWWVRVTPTDTGLGIEQRRVDSAHDAREKKLGRQPRPPRRTQLVATFDPLDERPAGDPRSDEVVWVHPNHDLSGRDRAAYLRRASVTFGGSTPAALPLAPWHFGSVDALARLLRARLLGADIQAGRLPEACACCGGEGRTDGRPDDRICDACGARWGRRQCGCGAWIPKLLPKLGKLADDQFDGVDYAARQSTLDLLVGRDGLADLCHADGALGKMWMVCPACGACGREAKGGCTRCQGVAPDP